MSPPTTRYPGIRPATYLARGPRGRGGAEGDGSVPPPSLAASRPGSALTRAHGARMDVRILGPMEIRNGRGELCAPRGPKQRLLMAILLVHAPRVVSVDRLTHTLWGDALPEDPTAALRTQVSRLRAFIQAACPGPDPVRSEAHGYRIDLAGVEVDAHRFESLLQESRALGDHHGECRALTEALALWRGDPWEEFADLPTFLGPTRSLVELRMGARERRVECLLALGRLSEALAEAEILVRQDPLRERPRALLMQAFHRCGRQAEALAAYQEFRRLLSDELGLDPSPGLRELERSILRHDPGEGEALLPGVGAPPQDIRFCTAADGVRLAYATMGQGPPLVKAANWLNHLEFDQESPVWRRLFRELAHRRFLVRYDERGSGLSDRDPPEMSLDAWVMDLEAIVEALGLERFPLLGISQGCAVCIEYAARHPERVSGLILHGGYAAGWRVDGSYSPDEVARRDASIAIIRHGWGEDIPAYRQMFTQTFIPGGTADEIAWFNELERRSVTPETAARFMEVFASLDVRHRLASLRCPTLVLHSRGDQRIRFERGRDLAAAIPGARFVPLESDNHLILEHEPAFQVWMAEAERFLAHELRA
jgi:DNA-binding SARP family transcriptional activator/pimeloyl-ACP methyl ester carboxylesterase